MNSSVYEDKKSHVEKSGGALRKFLVVLCSILLVVVPIVIIIIGIIIFKPEAEKKQKPRPVLAVQASYAVQTDVRLSVTLQGEVYPKTQIDLVPEIAGKIVGISPQFVEGGWFEKGDILFQIDKSDYQVAVVRAQANVASALQILAREKAEGEIARLDWQDMGGGVASDLTLRKPQLLEAKANLQAAQADLDNAKIRLSRTQMRAPFAGRVVRKNADIGQYVSPGVQLGQIFSSESVEVRLALTDSDIARLDIPLAYGAESYATGLPVKLQAIVAGGLREWEGRITRTNSVIDRQTRSLIAIAELRAPYNEGRSLDGYPLVPGLFVDAKVEGRVLTNVIRIPRSGLRPEDKVYTVDETGTAYTNSVKVIDANPLGALIASGINAGDLVITSPLEKSQINLRFKVIDADDPSRVLIVPPQPEQDEGEEKDTKNKTKRQ